MFEPTKADLRTDLQWERENTQKICRATDKWLTEMDEVLQRCLHNARHYREQNDFTRMAECEAEAEAISNAILFFKWNLEGNGLTWEQSK
jgi:hypothetical protein